jgi:hypothetical protein
MEEATQGAVAPAPTSSAPVTESAPQATTDVFSSPQGSEATPAAAGTPAPQGNLINQLYTSEGGLSENYTSLLEENGLGDLSNTVAKYQSPEGLLKGAANLISFAGKKVEGVVVPSEGSSDLEIADYRKAIGVPESATAYNLQPTDMPEGMDWDEGLAGEWSNVFHDAGLSQEQASQMAQSYSDITSKQLEMATNQINESAVAEMEAQRGEVQKLWGSNYESNMDAAVNMATTLGFDTENQADLAALRSPRVLNMLLEKHGSLQEGHAPRGGTPQASGQGFREQANALYGKYPNMALAPPDVRAKYHELRKLSSM